MRELRRTLRQRLVQGAVLSAAGLALMACQSVREAAGVEKTPPDEFAVVTKAPLVIPPDYNLRPPKPGAPPTNQSSPTDSAEAALSGTDPAAIAAALPNTYSPGEKTLLANSGAATANHHIRQQIAADAKSMATADDSFTDQLLFGSGTNADTGHPLDADAEHDKMVAEKSDKGTPVQDTQATGKSGSESATISADKSDTDTSSDGGWFDSIF